jgi:hypothetical protein
MKRIILFIAAIVLCSNHTFSQNKLILKNSKDSASLILVDSSLILKIDGKEYMKISKNNTLFLENSALAWEDLRVPVTATTAAGSNPPVFSSFMNSGGKFLGSSLHFDGINEYDSIPANAKLNFAQTDFSIAFWIQPESGILNDANILYKKGGWNISVQNKKIRIYLEGNDVFFSNIDLNMGTRNFVAISVKNNKSNGYMYVYINNKFAGKQSFNFPLIDNINPVFIGKAERKGYGNNYFGIIDELNFWKKYLTPEERDSLWNESMGTQKIVAKSAHVAGFGFDDESSSILSDNGGATDIKAYSANEKTSPAFTEGLISGTIISHGVFMYYFSKDIVQELFFTAQIPHSWAEGTEIEPHVHYVRPVKDTGTVVWGLEYTWENMNDVFGKTTTIYTYDPANSDANDQIYQSFGLQDGTGKKVSSMLVCRIFRDATNPKDTYAHDIGLLEVDFHVKNNSLGSSNIQKNE